MTSREVGMVVELDRDCEMGRKGERAVVMEVEGPFMRLLFPMRSESRSVRTGTDYRYLKVVP
jgi:hypothetical protein